MGYRIADPPSEQRSCKLLIVQDQKRNDLAVRSQRCSMATYVIVQDGAFFTVKLDDVSGPTIATFSNKLAADVFIEKQRGKEESAAKAPLHAAT